jgi:hypothetical protein
MMAKKKKPGRPKRPGLPEPDPALALEVHRFDGYEAALYPGMVIFEADKTAIRQGVRPKRRRPA